MSYDSEVLADAPWGYWEQNETSGTTLADASGNARNMLAYGQFQLNQAGPASGALAVAWPASPSQNQYAQSGSFTLTAAEVTTEAWVYLTATPTTVTPVVACAAAFNNSYYDKCLYVDATGAPAFYISTASGGVTVTGTPLSLNTWYHLVGSVGADGTKLRVNKATAATNAATASIATNPQRVFIHGGGHSASLDFTRGSAITIAKPAIYTAQLSDVRTDAHYNTMLGIVSGTTGTFGAPSPRTQASYGGSYAAPNLTGTLAASTRRVRLSFAGSTGAVNHDGALAAQTPMPRSAFSGTFVGTVTTTVTGNLLNGRERDGLAMVTVDAPVADPSSTGATPVVFGVDKAIALPDPRLVNGRPTNPAYAQVRANNAGTVKPAGRDRIIVGGVDITYLRGKTLQVPGYTLSEPFAYDSTSLTVPQVNPAFETLGTGSLRWARKGASVVFQRVYADGTKVTDYRGVVIAARSQGGALVLDIGGEVSGRAQLLNAQPPLFWKTADVGWLAWGALARVRAVMTPRGGPTTGIRIPKVGGMSWLAWMQQVCAMSQTNAGKQRTMMPKVWGGPEWRFDFKDTTTVDCTIFLDGTRAAEDLVDDASEQPNVWFGTGVTPDGVRWRNGRYPGLISGPAPDYPMAGGASFGPGTTDADTVGGSGVRALQYKLRWQHYLPWDEYLKDDEFTPGTYDDITTAAVKRLQRDVGLDVTGTVNKATWNALFDISATGYSLIEGSRIFPIVEDPQVRPWNYTANGSIASRNPKFDRRVLRVERNVDFGAGVRKPRAIDWCEGQDSRLDGPNWAGTITLNGIGAFAGKWDQGSSPSASDVLGMRDIRPGMNAWLPSFDGGTLVHISGVTYNPGMPGSVTLAVDTQARDLMELAQIIERNRQSRRNIRREWNHANRSNGPSHNQITFDEYGGRLDHDLKLQGGKWNVVPIVAGQTGQLERVDIRLTNTKAEFCMAIFSREMTDKHLHRRIGNPFPVDSNGETVWETQGLQDWFDDKTILYAAGNDAQPCGYWPRRKFGDKTDSSGNPVATGAPITGRYRDDAGVPYRTPSNTAPVVWLAIYPDRDCVLQSGRLLYKLEDDAV